MSITLNPSRLRREMAITRLYRHDTGARVRQCHSLPGLDAEEIGALFVSTNKRFAQSPVIA